MNAKKAKELRKLAKSMVAQELATAGAAYESRTYSRPAVLNPLSGEVVVPAYEVKTTRLMRNSEKGIYRALKRGVKKALHV